MALPARDEGMKKLAIAQISLGLLTIGSLVYWTGWLSTGYVYYQGTIPGSYTVLNSTGILPYNPLVDVWTIVYLVLGLAVLGCGIVQYIRVRDKSSGKWYKLERDDDGKVIKI